jgi:hypothetical protein
MYLKKEHIRMLSYKIVIHTANFLNEKLMGTRERWEIKLHNFLCEYVIGS